MSEFDTVTVQDAEGITAISPRLSEVKPGVDCIKLIAPRRVCQTGLQRFWHTLRGAMIEDLFLSMGITRSSFNPWLIAMILSGSIHS